MAAPKKDFEFKTLDGLLQFKASKKQCAAIMRVSEDTIERRIKEKHEMTFKEYAAPFVETTKIKLQQTAIAEALSGNHALLIFCLKNLCNWSDRVEHKIADAKPIQFKYSLEEPGEKDVTPAGDDGDDDPDS